MNSYSVALLLFAFGSVFVALLSLLRRKDDVARKFLWFSISVSGFGFPAAYWVTLNYSPDETEFLMRIAHVFAVFVPITWTHFVFEFIEKKEPFKKFNVVSYGVSFVLMVFCFFDVFMKDPRVVGSWKYGIQPGPVYHVFTLYFFSLVLYCFYCLVRAYWVSEKQQRGQLGCFVVATGFGFLGGAATFIMPYGYDTPVILALIHLMPLYPIFMGIGLIKYGLFDSEKMMDVFRRDKLAAIGTMTASLHHEIRNPLYVIQGSAQSFLYNQSNGAYKDSAEFNVQTRIVMDAVVYQSTRAIDIIKKFSNFAKYSPQHKPEVSRQKLISILENVRFLVQHELELQKVALEIRFDDEEIAVAGDARHLEEIFFNLVMNACQALASGGRVIQISVQQQTQTMVKVLIEDNGPGIPKSQLKKIFDPFYTTKDEGTGLGLYIVKQLVEKSGGKITVESEMGKGTRFVLEFPR